MKKLLVLAVISAFVSSCTIGDSGSGHRVPKKDSIVIGGATDTLISDNDQEDHKELVSVRVENGGGIMSVANPSHIKLMAGDIIEILRITSTHGNHDWEIHNTVKPETFTYVSDDSMTVVEHYRARVLAR